uniref:Uncharacterized protein n=1 Tax=Anguilla anguilla TaxID=7936 RepID=A0A0E9U047_ANGAN
MVTVLMLPLAIKLATLGVVTYLEGVGGVENGGGDLFDCKHGLRNPA